MTRLSEVRLHVAHLRVLARIRSEDEIRERARHLADGLWAEWTRRLQGDGATRGEVFSSPRRQDFADFLSELSPLAGGYVPPDMARFIARRIEEVERWPSGRPGGDAFEVEERERRNQDLAFRVFSEWKDVHGRRKVAQSNAMEKVAKDEGLGLARLRVIWSDYRDDEAFLRRLAEEESERDGASVSPVRPKLFLPSPAEP